MSALILALDDGPTVLVYGHRRPGATRPVLRTPPAAAEPAGTIREPETEENETMTEHLREMERTAGRGLEGRHQRSQADIRRLDQLTRQLSEVRDARRGLNALKLQVPVAVAEHVAKLVEDAFLALDRRV